MLGTLLRWAVRLFFFALIAGAVGFVITRLLGGDDEDFEDFEDLEASFEFNETPVEIDVSGPATTTDASSMDSDTSSDSDTDAGDNMSSIRSSSDTILLDEQTADDSEDHSTMSVGSNGATGGSRLIDIKGIGPSYESRLRSIGINTMNDLINADAEQIAEQVGVNGGASQVEDWKEQARAIISQGQE